MYYLFRCCITAIAASHAFGLQTQLQRIAAGEVSGAAATLELPSTPTRRTALCCLRRAVTDTVCSGGPCMGGPAAYPASGVPLPCGSATTTPAAAST